MPRILVVDDHPIVRKSVIRILRDSLESAADFFEASTAQEAQQMVAGSGYDLLLLDLTLPDASGLDLLRRLLGLQPGMPVLVLSMHPENQFALRAVALGAAGYLSKGSAPEDLIAAVRRVLSGGRYLTDYLVDRLTSQPATSLQAEPFRHERLSERELQTLIMTGEAKTIQQIATALGVSLKTVSACRARILKKMELNNSSELINYVVKNGLAS